MRVDDGRPACTAGKHLEGAKCVADHAQVEPMFQRVDGGWEIFCPAKTEPVRPKDKCRLASTVLTAKPTAGELMCRQVGAAPAFSDCK